MISPQQFVDVLFALLLISAAVLLCLLMGAVIMVLATKADEALQSWGRHRGLRKTQWVCPLSGQRVGFSQEFCMKQGCPEISSSYSTVYAVDRHEMISSLTLRPYWLVMIGQKLSSWSMIQRLSYWWARRRLVPSSVRRQRWEKSVDKFE